MDIIPSINFDHWATVLHFDSIEKQKFGPSYWKFNASLLEVSEFILMINQKVPDWREELSDVSDKRVLWDLIKYRIRQATIKYSKEKACVRRDKLASLETTRKSQRSVRKVFSKDGFLTTDPRKIMAEVENYYTNLYKSEPPIGEFAAFLSRQSGNIKAVR